MSERSLPDDPAHWPNDPNELLGVSFGVTPRELRRAYHRLIRIYKPEQFPEQFRRIREAYEYLLRIVEWCAPRAESPAAAQSEETQLASVPKEPAAKEEIPLATERPPRDELDELWDAAIAGRPAGAYEYLAQRIQQQAGKVEFYQRLYWLRTLWPDLDARRAPADWLVEGLLTTGLAGPLRELYREEVTDHPAEALSERYERLLDAPITAALLADLIEWRFRAAMQLQRGDILNADLPKLGRRFGIGEEQVWLRLVFALADRAAWTTDAEGQRQWAGCRAEIARHEHMASQMPYFFDRFDLLLEASRERRRLSQRKGVLAAVWRAMNTDFDDIFSVLFRRRVPALLVHLIGSSWSRPLAEFRGPLLAVLEAMAGAPQQWLKTLELARKRAPATLALFGELLDRLEQGQSGAEMRADGDNLTELALAFVSRLNVVKYQKERERLLLFFIRENIAPEAVAEAASGAWERALMDDWPLRYVCRACRLFWG